MAGKEVGVLLGVFGMTRVLMAAVLAVLTPLPAVRAGDWRFRADDPDRVYLYVDGVQKGGWCYREGHWRSLDKDGTWGKPEKACPEMPPAPKGRDALAEVNALRARSGLPAYIYDAGLTAAAQSCAEHRAAYGIEFHTSNDFAFVPAGSHANAAGCAAWHPNMGWGSCCCYDRYTFAGAGWAIGRDGRRYMHLFVR